MTSLLHSSAPKYLLSRVSQPLKATDVGVVSATDSRTGKHVDTKIKTLDGGNEIVSLAADDSSSIERLADCYSNCLENDPTVAWLADGKGRERVREYLRGWALMSLRALSSHQHPLGASCWAVQTSTPTDAVKDAPAVTTKAVCIFYQHPSSAPSKWDMLRSGGLRVLLSMAGLRSASYWAHMSPIFSAAKDECFKEHGKFLYVSCFALAPECRQEACGSELLQSVVEHADELGLPTYFEARTAESRQWFESHGFQVFQEASYSAEVPSQYIMLRLPLAKAAHT